MHNESYEDIQPEIKPMMEHYLLLRRQGKEPTIEKFIQRYPEEHQQTLRKELEAYEQLHLLFSALQQYQAEKIAAELSEEQVEAAHKRFQQQIESTPHRKTIFVFIQRLKNYVEVWIESIRNVARVPQEVFLGETTEGVMLSPHGKIRETVPCLRVTLQRDTGIVLKSVQFLLFDSSGELLLQTKTEDILVQEGADIFEVPLAGHVNLETGKRYRFEAYLNFDENGEEKRRYLGESFFEVES